MKIYLLVPPSGDNTIQVKADYGKTYSTGTTILLQEDKNNAKTVIVATAPAGWGVVMKDAIEPK